MNTQYTELIKRISKHIVSKTKVSLLLAEEIRQLDKCLKNYVITRWNSILFMIRSVLKLTPDDFKQLIKTMPTSNQKQRDAIKLFRISELEREMLSELVDLLEIFEWLTNEFQSNKVSSSRVYPTVMAVKHKLSDHTQSYNHTFQLREDLLKSLNKRFNEYIDKECFKLATYLDPLMGPLMFKPTERQVVINMLKRQIALANPSLANSCDKSS